MREPAGPRLSRASVVWDRWETRLTVWAILLIFVLEVSGTYDVITTLTGVPLYVLALAGTAAMAAVVYARHRVILSAPMIGFGLMVLATVVSYARSRLDPSVTMPGVNDALKNFVFITALAVLAARTVPWRGLAIGFSLTTGLIGYLSGLNEFVLGRSASFLGYDTVTTYEGVGFAAGRHAGPMPDPNFWGRELVAVVPFALALVRDAWMIRRDNPRRAAVQALIGLWGFGGQLIAAYLTGSRGTYLSLTIATLIFLVASGVRLRWIAAGAVIGAPLALAVPGVASRLFSFSLSQAGLDQSAAVDGSVMERLATQRVALAMAQDNVISGVGPDGYFSAFGRYGAATQQALARVVAPHNLYLGTTAELGVLGLGAWLILVGTALWLAVRATRRRAAPQMHYAAAVLAGIIAWSVASIFLHASHIRVILALAVLAAAAEWHTRPYASSRHSMRIVLRDTSWLQPLAVVRATAAGLVVAAVLGVLVNIFGITYRATATGYLRPQSDNIYLLDLRTRTAVATTYAVLHEIDEENKVDVQGDPASGLLRLSAHAGTAREARALATTAIADGTTLVGRSTLNRLYASSWGSIQMTAVPTSPLLVVGSTIGSFLGTVALVLAGAWFRRPGRDDGR